MYDLIIKGGTVVDPAQNLHGLSDVAVQEGKIALVAPDIPSDQAKRIVEGSREWEILFNKYLEEEVRKRYS